VVSRFKRDHNHREMKYSVYILRSAVAEKYYIGYTNNLKRRIEEHNTQDKGYTRNYRPWVIEYSEEFSDRGSAMKRESYLKSLKNKYRIQEYIAGWRSGTSRGS
jgi:putative endonuclease